MTRFGRSEFWRRRAESCGCHLACAAWKRFSQKATTYNRYSLLVIDFHETIRVPCREMEIQGIYSSGPFSGPVTVFLDRQLPEAATPVGYAAPIDRYFLAVPVPLMLCAIGPRHKVYEADGWRIFTPRHQPDETFSGDLIFALRYEGVDLRVLRALFRTTGLGPIEEIVRNSPTGAYARRI